MQTAHVSQTSTEPFVPELLKLTETAILLDVDGTIIDLATRPQDVVVPPSLLGSLKRLHVRTGGAIALVSGRLIRSLDDLFAPLRIPAIGGHGAEMRIAAQDAVQPRYQVRLDPRFKHRLSELADLDNGIILEDKGTSFALHYRLAPHLEPCIKSGTAALLDGMSARDYELLGGKYVVEVKPRSINKGAAVRELMRHAPFAGRRPVFVGDDTTDESVFAVLPDFDGLGYSVGRAIAGVNGAFDTPAQVRAWLTLLCGQDGRADA